MTEYIEKQAAIESALAAVPRDDYFDRQIEVFINLIPPADVRPVVRGKWIQDCDYHFRCSICSDRWTVSNGNPLDVANEWNFCPNCGADMREQEEKLKKDPFEGWSEELKETYRKLLASLHLDGGDAE